MLRFGHMSWLDDRIADSKELDRKKAELDTDAPKLYADLWDELSKIATEANSKAFSLVTSGSGTDRKIRRGLSRLDTASTPSQLQGVLAESTISLLMSPDKRSIRVRGDFSISFDVAVCADGIVSLKQDGNSVSIGDAAEQIMGRFLFPELQPNR